MNTAAWVLVGAAAGFCLVVAVCVVIREAKAKAAWIVRKAASEEPAPHLEDQRITTGATCFRCRKEPAEQDGLWCTKCHKEVHELDANDTRPLEDK
jgi:uncharacterized paraquat-inducible protein A